MPHICFILDNIDIGGIERNTVNLANTLVELGHEVTIVSLRNGRMAEYLSDKVTLEILNSPRVLSPFFLWFYFLRNRSCDAVICAKDFMNIFTILAHKLSSHKAKLITTTRVNLKTQIEQRPHFAFSVIYFLARILYPLANYNVGVSQGVCESLKTELKCKNDKVKLIYNPTISPELLELTPDKPDIPIYQANSEIVIGAGRFVAAKNFDLLIDAFAIVKKNVPRAQLVLLGEGEEEEYLHAKVKTLGLEDDVYFPGFISTPYSYFYHASVFVLSSLYEGFGNVVAESLAMGTPVVTTNCPSGPAEILDFGEYGTIVDSYKAADLAKAIEQQLSATKPDRKFLRERAACFTPHIAAQEYLKLLSVSE